MPNKSRNHQNERIAGFVVRCEDECRDRPEYTCLFVFMGGKRTGVIDGLMNG